MPPLEVFTQGKLIALGFDRTGLRTSPLPMAINSVPYGGRPACLNDGWCDAGCAILALANLLAVYLPQAIKAGAVLRNDSYVTRVSPTGPDQRRPEWSITWRAVKSKFSVPGSLLWLRTLFRPRGSFSTLRRLFIRTDWPMEVAALVVI